jgi:hypothetical protein
VAVTRTSTGAMASSAAATTAVFGAGAAAGDLGILIVETANQAITTPTGWTLDKGGTGTGTGVAAAAGGLMLSLYHKSSISAGDISGGISISDSGDHQNALLLTYSGSDPNGRYGAGSPVSVSALNTGTPATTSVATNGLSSAAFPVSINDIALCIIVTDRDSATVSTNTANAWVNITGSDSFIVNASSATGAGGGVIVNELVPSGSSTAAVTFSCSITSSIYISALVQIYAPQFTPFNRQARLTYMML